MDREIVYRVSLRGSGWELSEERMPESVLHDDVVKLLVAILDHWARGKSMRIARNLAVRWDAARPAVGVDPDVSVLAPAPPPEPELRSVRTWLPGHTAPKLAIEVVSTTNPNKDYVIAPDKYAASGTEELWIFDPLLSGPRSHGGPFRLQMWRWDGEGRFTRVHAGDAPAWSPALGGFVVTTEESTRLRIADDAVGARLWPTAEEAALAAKEHERAAKEHERAAKEHERAAKEAAIAAKEAALARVAELEAALKPR